MLAIGLLLTVIINPPALAQQGQQTGQTEGQYQSQSDQPTYPPQYPPPEYQVPQYPPLPYQQPQYPPSQEQGQAYPPQETMQPQYQQPQYQQPQYQQPQYQPPQYQQPQQQQPYPQRPYQPPVQPQQPQMPMPTPGLLFNDPFQQFQLALPQGAMPYSATYNFGDAETGIQINVMAAQKDEIYDMAFKSFPSMVQSMGGTVRSNRAASIYGRQGQQIVAMMPDPQTGRQLMTLNVFIPAAKIWVQVISTEAQANYSRQLMNMIVQSLQFQ